MVDIKKIKEVIRILEEHEDCSPEDCNLLEAIPDLLILLRGAIKNE